jgi:hypothetical protein
MKGRIRKLTSLHSPGCWESKVAPDDFLPAASQETRVAAFTATVLDNVNGNTAVTEGILRSFRSKNQS